MAEDKSAGCGSPSCLATTMEELLSKQYAAQNEFIKTLFQNHVNTLSASIERVETKLDKNIDELYRRMRDAESDIKVVQKQQVGIVACNEAMSEAEARFIKLEAKMEKGLFSEDQKQKIINAVEFIEGQRSVVTKIVIGVVTLVIIAALGWGLFLFNQHPSPGTVRGANTSQSTTEEMTPK